MTYDEIVGNLKSHLKNVSKQPIKSFDEYIKVVSRIGDGMVYVDAYDEKISTPLAKLVGLDPNHQGNWTHSGWTQYQEIEMNLFKDATA